MEHAVDIQKHQDPISPKTKKQDTFGQPSWWTAQNDDAWERVKDAFQRDWQQTKADFFPASNMDLNQGVVDTVKQAAGAQPVPPITQKSHPDTDAQAAKAHHRLVNDQEKANTKIEKAAGKITEEKAELANKVTNIQDDVAQRNAVKQKDMALAERNADGKAAAKIADATASADKSIQKDRADMAKATLDRDAANAKWLTVEPAARYGYAAREHNKDAQQWNGRLEDNLRKEWNGFNMGASWEDSMEHVKRGWEYGGGNTDAKPSEVTDPQRRNKT